MSSIKVQPKEIVEVLKIHSIKVEVNSLNLGQDANVIVAMLNENNEVIKIEGFMLSQPDYDLWVSDEWLFQYVCDKYGLVVIQNT